MRVFSVATSVELPLLPLPRTQTRRLMRPPGVQCGYRLQGTGNRGQKTGDEVLDSACGRQRTPQPFRVIPHFVSPSSLSDSRLWKLKVIIGRIAKNRKSKTWGQASPESVMSIRAAAISRSGG